MSKLIDRQAAIDRIDEALKRVFKEPCGEAILANLPSAQPEPLTDVEQGIFLKAISREEEVCKKEDAEWGDGDSECEINLVHICHEIERKVKGALWT